MITAQVKDFADFLHGKEVVATVQGRGDEKIEQGQHVLAIKDSVASKPALTVPQSKLHQAMGIEATVVSVDVSREGRGQTVLIRKD